MIPSWSHKNIVDQQNASLIKNYPITTAKWPLSECQIMVTDNETYQNDWIKSLLEDPNQNENPLKPALALLYSRERKSQAKLKRLLDLADGYGQLHIATLSANYEKQCKRLEKVNRIADIYQQHMRELNEKLKTAYQELQQNNQQLLTTQTQLMQAEKMAALGQLISGIAHEINTPLGAMSSSATNIQNFLQQILTLIPLLFQSFSQEKCEAFLFILNQSLIENTEVLSAKEQRQKRHSLIKQLEGQVENEFAVADTLVDMGIYKNIDNVIAFLKQQHGLDALELAYKFSELKKSTQTIIMAAERTAKVVFALKAYSQQNDSGVKITTSIINGIETVLTLYANQMKHGIKIIKNYADNLPMINCYPDELNQVWINLIHNALQAMNYEGILVINVEQQNNTIKIDIQDNGIGISPENYDKIFDAFYTTKAVGEGSGLGLHIVKKIIDKHAGEIRVKSQTESTVFTVLLPISENQ